MTTQTYSQAPAPLDLKATSGDDWGIQLTFTSDGTTPINLTGYTWSATVFPIGLPASSVATIAVTETTPASGVIDLSLTDTQTSALIGPYRWSITYTNGSDTFTPVAGQFLFLIKGQVR